jgi:hypothetical protein
VCIEASVYAETPILDINFRCRCIINAFHERVDRPVDASRAAQKR